MGTTMNSEESTPNTDVSPWRQGLQAARKNIIPGICIWLIAGAVLGAWYVNDSAQMYLTQLGDFKNEWNYSFSFLSTAIAGALIPGTIMGIWKLHPRAWTQLPWLFVFWGLKGIEINALYQLQDFLFGSDTDWQTLGTKTFVDQCIYVPLYGAISLMFFYAWLEGGYTGMKKIWHDRWYSKHCLPVIIASLGVWLPTVILIYMLPTPLQLPLQNLVLCFWALMMAVLVDRKKQDDKTHKPLFIRS